MPQNDLDARRLLLALLAPTQHGRQQDSVQVAGTRNSDFIRAALYGYPIQDTLIGIRLARGHDLRASISHV